MRMLPVYGLVLVALAGCTGLQYEENPTGLTVTGWRGTVPESIVIPKTVDGVPVTKIKWDAFNFEIGRKDNLKKVTIPDSVTEIGNWALSASHLTSVTIPGSVTKIGAGAFGYTDLTSITIPGGVERIDDYTFAGCDELTSITISEGVESIGKEAFENCKKLTSITLPNSLKSIGDGAFLGCSNLTSITFSNNLVYIDDNAFKGCSSLSSITLPGSLTNIGDNVFEDCSSLRSVVLNVHYTQRAKGILKELGWMGIGGVQLVLPNGMQAIENHAFSNCAEVTSVVIPDSVTEIGESAFARCWGLTSITLPERLTKIGSSAFARCPKLTSIAIPEGVTEIGESAFAGCSGLTSVTIPKSVTKIDVSAFENCSGLTSIALPEGVTEIGKSAFAGCSGLTSVTIPKSVTKIDSSAFEECSSLASIAIPEGVTEIGESAFAGCSVLTSVTIPKSVTKIDSSAFKNCSGLTSIAIPEGVREIGESAFAGCSGLTSVTLTDNVATIGTQAFPWRQITPLKLKSQGSRKVQTLLDVLNEQAVKAIQVALLVVDGVERIEDGAFANQKNIVSVELPESVKHLGKNAFVGCTNLQTITLRFTGEPPVGAFPYFWKFCKWQVPSKHQAAWEAAIAQGRFNGVAIDVVNPSGTKSVLAAAKMPKEGWKALTTGTPEANLRFAMAMGDIEEAKRFAEEVTELDASAPQKGELQQLTLLEECLALEQTDVAEILYKRGAAGVDIAKAEFWRRIPSESAALTVVKWLSAEDREVLSNGEKAKFSSNLAFVTFLRLNKLSFAEAVRSHYGLSCQNLRIEEFGLDDNRLSAQQAVELVDYLVNHGTPLDDLTEDYSVLVALLEDQDKEISETKRAVLLYLIERGADVNATIKTRLVSKREEHRIEALARDIAQSPFLLDDLLERAGASEEALREAELAYEKFQKKLEQLPLAMSMFYGDSIYSNPFYAGAMDSAVDKIVAKETKEIVLKALEQSGRLDYDTVETPVLFSMIARKEGALANAMLEHGATLPCIKRDPKNGDENAIDEALRVGNRELAQRLRQLERQRARNR